MIFLTVKTFCPMKKLLFTFLLMVGCLLSSNVASAQGITVSGYVTSSYDDEPIMGVTVVLKGTTIGTMTDINGYYTINPVSPSGTLVFSGMGYYTKEVPINGNSNINVKLDESCVVIGSENDTSAKKEESPQ